MEFKRVFENNEWDCIHPMDFEASKEYAGKAKFATNHREEYFKMYSENGLIVYCVNKEDESKLVGIFLPNNEKSSIPPVWDVNCYARKIEETSLPVEIFNKVVEYKKSLVVK